MHWNSLKALSQCVWEH